MVVHFLSIAAVLVVPPSSVTVVMMMHLTRSLIPATIILWLILPATHLSVATCGALFDDLVVARVVVIVALHLVHLVATAVAVIVVAATAATAVVVHVVIDNVAGAGVRLCVVGILEVVKVWVGAVRSRQRKSAGGDEAHCCC